MTFQRPGKHEGTSHVSGHGLLKLELPTTGSALDFSTFLLPLKRITGPLPQNVVIGLS